MKMSLKTDIEKIKREKSNPEQTKSAEDAGIKDKTVSDMIQWEDDYNETYCEEENGIIIYRDKDGLLQSRRR